MPKALKVVVWIVAFAAAAAAGAYMASRADPFPPGVEDPGARPTLTPTSSSEPATWGLTMRSETRHDLHEGGTCRSDWVVTGTLVELRRGDLEGTAVARLDPPAGCDFPQAQVQTRRVDLLVTGRVRGGSVVLAFEAMAASPDGSQDLGGFLPTLHLIQPKVELGPSDGEGSITVTIADGDRGRYGSANEVQLSQ